MNTLLVGYLQFEPIFGDVAANTENVLGALDGIEADLIVLPELAFTGYAFKDRDETLALAEDPAESQTIGDLRELCSRQGMHIVTGFAELKEDKCFNSALLLGPGGVESVYRKLHLFDAEKACFDPGDTPLAVSRVKGCTVGMMICFDWIFPETARILALLGADLICHPSNLVIPDKCQHAMVTRCVENRVFAITANRYGVERDVEFTGQSQIVTPDGNIADRAPPSGDQLKVVEIDPARARDKNITSRNDLIKDRRPQFYGAISEHTFFDNR